MPSRRWREQKFSQGSSGMRRPGIADELVWPVERAREFGERFLELWLEHQATLADLPVARDQSPAEVAEAVRLTIPDEPLADDDLIHHLREVVDRGVQVGHGGFMAYITGAGTAPGGPASLLAAGINQNAGGWVLGPAATELETHLLRWFAQRLGLPATASGAFVAGGATANYMALAVARDTLAGWDVRRDGVAAGPPLAVYASEDVHDTIDRAADLLGLGTAAVRRIDTDERLRMRPALLAERIAQDLDAGVQPLCVVGTAGTTEFGAIDPLDSLADIAAEHRCWFHVDAAYGGPAAMTDALRPAFAGIERADSITCDPHKWLNTPISSSLVLFRDPAAQHAAFTLETDYTRYDDAAAPGLLMRYQWTPQFTRPFDALPVWVSLLAHGWQAFERRIPHDVELAAWLHHLVGEHAELEQTIEPQLSIVCFRYVPPDLAGIEAEGDYLDVLNERILYRLQKGGRVYPSNAVFRGRYVLRACLVTYRTEADDVEALVDQTVALGRQLDRELRPGVA